MISGIFLNEGAKGIKFNFALFGALCCSRRVGLEPGAGGAARDCYYAALLLCSSDHIGANQDHHPCRLSL